MAPSLRTLCFAIITASATIVSLMLTTLSFAQQLENRFDNHFYVQLKSIALLGSAALIVAVIVLLILTIPLTESETLRPWFTVVYYVLMLCAATISTLIVAIIIMLYGTMSDLIGIVRPDEEHRQPSDKTFTRI